MNLSEENMLLKKQVEDISETYCKDVSELISRIRELESKLGIENSDINVDPNKLRHV